MNQHIYNGLEYTAKSKKTRLAELFGKAMKMNLFSIQPTGYLEPQNS